MEGRASSYVLASRQWGSRLKAVPILDAFFCPRTGPPVCRWDVCLWFQRSLVVA